MFSVNYLTSRSFTPKLQTEHVTHISLLNNVQALSSLKQYNLALEDFVLDLTLVSASAREIPRAYFESLLLFLKTDIL